MSKTKLIRILSGILLAGVLIVEGLAFWLVGQLNMLPDEYMVLLAAFLLVLWVALAALLFIPGKKEKASRRGQDNHGGGAGGVHPAWLRHGLQDGH